MKEIARGHVRHRRQETEEGVKEAAARAAHEAIELARDVSKLQGAALTRTRILTYQEIASIIFHPWQGVKYMELEVGCLFEKLSGRFDLLPFGRICMEGRRTLGGIVARLGEPGKVHANVLRQGTTPKVQGVTFLELEVVERDTSMGRFVAPEEFFRCCSRAVAYGFARR